MHVRRVALVDFRNYADARVDLAPGINLLLGANGQGKTNFVEALGYAATLASHRVASDAPLVRNGAARAVVRVEVSRDGRSTPVELEINPGRANRARLAGMTVPRPRDVLGALRVVTFAPEDIALVKGDPAERRRFLDELLVARAPRFASVRADYDRVLRQRSTLLKSAGHANRGRRLDLTTLDVWDRHLVVAGTELLAGRIELVDSLSPVLDKAYAGLAAGAGMASAIYRCSIAPEGQLTSDRERLAEVFTVALGEARSTELERGVCLVGPQRDDLMLKVGTLPARGYASHGESWSLALALRLAAYELLRSEGGEPVLVLDDVFAELDTDRRIRLAELVAGAEQVLVTAAVELDVPMTLTGTRLEVVDGQVAGVR